MVGQAAAAVAAAATTLAAAVAAMEVSVVVGVVGGLTGVATIAGILYGVKWRVSAEAASSAADELRKALSDADARERRHVDELKEMQAQIVECKERLAAMPDLAAVLERVGQHDQRATDRHVETVAVLQALAAAIAGRPAG